VSYNIGGNCLGIVSVFYGLITKIITMESMALEVGLPVIVASLIYITIGLVRHKHVSQKVKTLMAALAKQK